MAATTAAIAATIQPAGFEAMSADSAVPAALMPLTKPMMLLPMLMAFRATKPAATPAMIASMPPMFANFPMKPAMAAPAFCAKAQILLKALPIAVSTLLILVSAPSSMLNALPMESTEPKMSPLNSLLIAAFMFLANR